MSLRFGVILMLIIAVILVIFIGWRGQHNDKVNPERESQSIPRKNKNLRDSSGEGISRQRYDRLLSKETEKLKSEWLQLAKIYGYDARGWNQEEFELAKKTVTHLLSSKDLIDLIEFLKHEKIHAYALIENEAKLLFSSIEFGKQARNELIRLSKLNSEIYYRYSRQWSYYAGVACPRDEFEAFCSALDDADLIREAKFGQGKSLINVDATGATQLVIEAMNGQEPAQINSNVISDLLYSLDSEIDFKKIEEIIPTSEVPELRDAYISGRIKLIERWSEFDPVNAASYIIENQDRFSSNAMSVAVKNFVIKAPAEAVDWIQDLPTGAFLDSAIAQAATTIAIEAPDTGRELISRISDPQLRRETLREFKEYIDFANRDPGQGN